MRKPKVGRGAEERSATGAAVVMLSSHPLRFTSSSVRANGFLDFFHKTTQMKNKKRKKELK
jgi:hypothetical protein